MLNRWLHKIIVSPLKLIMQEMHMQEMESIRKQSLAVNKLTDIMKNSFEEDDLHAIRRVEDVIVELPGKDKPQSKGIVIYDLRKSRVPVVWCRMVFTSTGRPQIVARSIRRNAIGWVQSDRNGVPVVEYWKAYVDKFVISEQ